jgi:hypothetical protein
MAKSKSQSEFIDFVYRSPLRQRVSDKLLNRMRLTLSFFVSHLPEDWASLCGVSWRQYTLVLI